ncbi:MAG TPA: hypothetical protein VM779_01360 [Thermoanaerobaculia bacterium]|nr:hypothetical protein [Thermoanaerobaculia bacterium]
MERKVIEETRWLDLTIVCPHCGNRGRENGEWNINAWTPFKLIEEIVRSWVFAAERAGDGKISITADTYSDSVDRESGSNLRLECMQCFGEFALPDDARVDWD